VDTCPLTMRAFAGARCFRIPLDARASKFASGFRGLVWKKVAICEGEFGCGLWNLDSDDD